MLASFGIGTLGPDLHMSFSENRLSLPGHGYRAGSGTLTLPGIGVLPASIVLRRPPT
jgi:hypothetical protein